jgi:hypothetical protein
MLKTPPGRQKTPLPYICILMLKAPQARNSLPYICIAIKQELTTTSQYYFTRENATVN